MGGLENQLAVGVAVTQGKGKKSCVYIAQQFYHDPGTEVNLVLSLHLEARSESRMRPWAYSVGSWSSRSIPFRSRFRENPNGSQQLFDVPSDPPITPTPVALRNVRNAEALAILVLIRTNFASSSAFATSRIRTARTLAARDSEVSAPARSGKRGKVERGGLAQ